MKMKQIYYVMLMSLFSSQLFCAFTLPVKQNQLQPIDFSSLTQFKDRLATYVDYDDHLKELQSALLTQEEQLKTYNKYVENYENLTDLQQQSLSESSFQNLIHVSKIEIDRLAKLSDVVMQSKNIDPTWQVQKNGFVFGSLSFVKNLVLPQSWRSCFYAGGGALTGLAALKCLPKSSTIININLPAGVENVKISDDAQQKLLTTVAECALGAGTVIAASQLYNSWMHEADSRNSLTDKITAMHTSNALIGQTFNTIGVHTAMTRLATTQQKHGMAIGRVHEGIDELKNGAQDDRQQNTRRHNELKNSLSQVGSTTKKMNVDVAAIKENVSQLQESSQQMNQKLDDLAQSLGVNKQEAQALKECLENFKGTADEAIQLLQAKLNKNFDRQDRTLMAIANMHIAAHKETQDNLKIINSNISLFNSSSSSQSSHQEKFVAPLMLSDHSALLSNQLKMFETLD